MSPTRYFKRAWFWLGMGTGTLALTGLIAWLWKTRPHGPQIQPVLIDFSFVRPPAEAARGLVLPDAPAAAARAVVVAAQAPEPELEPEAPPVLDDLARLVGIGPRIAGVLREAGLDTFARLAQADPAALRELLRTHNLRLADPETWPEQAHLAAAGRWDEIRQIAARRRSPRGMQ